MVNIQGCLNIYRAIGSIRQNLSGGRIENRGFQGDGIYMASSRNITAPQCLHFFSSAV